MLKAYKYRIYPNKVQKELLVKTFGCCRFVYNQTLVYRKEKYQKDYLHKLSHEIISESTFMI